jgi:hypothetical protein
LNEQKDESKQKENMSQGKKDSKVAPKILQCSGGHGNDSTSTNEPAVEESRQSNQTTANLNHITNGNDDGGFGGDGNDPPKRNPELLKGHYLEPAVKNELNEGILF